MGIFEERIYEESTTRSETCIGGLITAKKVMEIIDGEFKKEYDMIKADNTNLYGLLEIQHERQELIERWFGNGKT